MLLATVLALLTLLVVWIRRSAFGRRLLAMRDSEAACATLGMRLLIDEDCGVRDLGRAWPGSVARCTPSQLQSVQITTFNFIVGLPVLLAAVVGGMAYAGTGPFSGVSLQAGLPLLAKIGPFFANLAGLLPGLAGIGLGRNPNGAIADMRDAFGRAWRDKRIFAAIIGRRDRASGCCGSPRSTRTGPYVILAGLWGLAWLLSVAGADRLAQMRAARGPQPHTVPARVGRSDRAVARRRPRRAGPPARGDGCGAARCLLRPRPRSRPSGASLEVREVTVRFGGNVALDGVSISARSRCRHRLDRSQRRGKDDAVQRHHRAAAAERRPGGHRPARTCRACGPSSRARLGMARTFQRLELFTLLSVRENIRVAVDVRKTGGTDPAQFVDDIIERIGLSDVADARVDSLSTGRARLVELGRALATKPKVLLLDEPASGQDENETDAFGRLLRELAHEGIAVLLVEHDMQLVMQVCDLIHVLDFGRIIAVGTAAEIQQDEAVLAAYLGTKS